MHIIIFRGRKQNEGDLENLKKSLDEERRKAEVCSCAHFDLTFLLKKILAPFDMVLEQGVIRISWIGCPMWCSESGLNPHNCSLLMDCMPFNMTIKNFLC